MDLIPSWVNVALILFTVWIGVVRETRLAMTGYILQVVSLLVLYLYQIFQTGESSAFIGWSALLIIRLIAIPILIYSFLKKSWWHDRVTSDLIDVRKAVPLYAFLAIFGFMMGRGTGNFIGTAVSVLLLGISIVLLKHDPSKQVFGILSVDAAGDLMVIYFLNRLPLFFEILIYLIILWSAVCMVILVKSIERRTKVRSVKQLTNLKG